MQNKINIGIFWICILVALAGVFYSVKDPSNPLGWDLLNTGFRFAQILGIIYLIRNSYLYKTRLFRFIQVIIGILFVGDTFKILHWYFADQILLLSYFSMVILYSIHFATKKPIKILDIGKELFLICFLTGIYFTILHWPYAQQFRLCSCILITVIMGYFTICPWLFKKIPEKEDQLG